jgi:hypothetical protein
MLCKKCNFKNDADARFCENCGAGLQDIFVEKPRNKWKLPLIISGGILLLIIILLYIIAIVVSIISINDGRENRTEYLTSEQTDSIISYENNAAEDSVGLSDTVSFSNKTEGGPTKKTASESTGSYYNVITEFAYIYDYYGNSETDAYFDKIPGGSYFPYGTTLLIEYEFKGFGKITYRNEKGNDVRGFILMSDLKRN